MTEWLAVGLTIILFYAGIAVHELGHAMACRRIAVPVVEICLLGWPLPRVPSLTLPIRSRMFPGTRWVLHPFIVGAYMQPDEASMNAATRRDRVAVLAMGPIANCLYGWVLLAVAALAAVASKSGLFCAECSEQGLGDTILGSMTSATAAILVATFAALALITYATRNCRLTHWGLLAFGIIAMPVMVALLASMVSDAITATKPWHEVFPGPFAILAMTRDFVVENLTKLEHPVFHPLAVACAFAGALSIFLGLINMVPLIAGDGTMMLMEYVPEFIGRWIWSVTIAVVLSMLVFGVVGDVLWIWSWWRG